VYLCFCSIQRCCELVFDAFFADFDVVVEDGLVVLHRLDVHYFCLVDEVFAILAFAHAVLMIGSSLSSFSRLSVNPMVSPWLFLAFT
jgi:hypothetical protein